MGKWNYGYLVLVLLSGVQSVEAAYTKLEQGYLNQILVKAVTLCPEKDNPLTGLRALQGNLFEDISVEQDSDKDLTVIRAKVVHSLRELNRASLAMDEPKGKLTLEMGYRFNPPVDRVLYCKLLTEKG